jgi:hypothetical protein
MCSIFEKAFSAIIEGRPEKLFFSGLALFLCLMAAALPAFSQQTRPLSALLQEAREKKLHADRYWHILLHYRKSLMGFASLIDDPDFFLSETGKHDPQRELEANLAAFFDESEPQKNGVRCRFPARFEWLSRQLGIAVEPMPGAACEKLREAYDKVEPRSATLIFPGTNNNSPASMFGHTLINIEGPYQSKLLSYAVNYSAFTDETNGFAYAIKGIFGLYPGYFSILPYYQKLREYADLERRDVWEYQLNLDPEETRRMFLHIWELREIYSDYFFFDENCAYQLLFLLEAARPAVDLTDRCRVWVIPIDTVRVIREAGLIRSSRYRPSKATRIARIASQMSVPEQKITLQVLDGSLPPDQLEDTGLSREARIRILDLASESVEFSYFKEKLTREEYRRRYLSLLQERSYLGPSTPEPEWIEPGRPDLGHGSNRFSLGSGFWDSRFYLEMKLRPAYHDLADSDAGYVAGSQIDFVDLVLRYYPEDRKVELYNLNLIDIVSLAPRSRFSKPISWKVKTGLVQRLFDGGDDHLVYELSPGGGFCYGSKRTLFYGMIETEILASDRFDEKYAAGIGGSVGVLWSFDNFWKSHASIRHIQHELGETHQSTVVKFDQTLVTGPSSSIILSFSRQRVFKEYATDIGLSWNFFW